jgi:hypothetical protein
MFESILPVKGKHRVWQLTSKTLFAPPLVLDPENQVMWLGLFRVHERVFLTSMNLHDESISVMTLVNLRGFESSDRHPDSHQQGVKQLEQDFDLAIEAVKYSQRTTEL